MTRRYFMIGIAVFLFSLLSTYPSVSLGGADKGQLLEALQAGNHVIYFRHGEKGKDPNITPRLPKQFDQCLFPNVLLTEVGASSMQTVGQQFKQLQIPVGQVLASPACRCIESAWLGFGEATVDSSLNGVYEKDRAGQYVINETVTDDLALNLRHALVKAPDPGTNTLLFAHSSNILALTGLKLKQGEAAIFKPDDQGHFVYVSRLTLEEWQHLKDKEKDK